MKIAGVETFVVDGGFRPWTYVKVETDEGVTGWGECSNSLNPNGIVGTIEDMKGRLMGADPRAFEMRFWDMVRGTRQSSGGIVATAIAGVELALVDIKAKALGISVSELFGGPLRDRVRVYWTHCATLRVIKPEAIGKPAPRTMEEVAAIAREVPEAGYTALKTNIFFPGDPARIGITGFERGPGTTDQVVSNETLRHAEKLIGTFRDAVGPDVEIAVDISLGMKPESSSRLAKVLEPFDLMWLEIDTPDPDALRMVRESTSTTIATGEMLRNVVGFLPYFQGQAADVYLVDAMWNGFSQAKKIGDLAEVFQLNVSPHNPKSHLGTFISAHLCAVLPNVRIMEYEVEDIPWKDGFTTAKPEIVDGHMVVPKGPGWGIEVDEEFAQAHPWDPSNAKW